MSASRGQTQRILSGIQPSGELHIGNYLGAMRQHVELQAKGQGIYFVADYHSMTSVRDASERRSLVHDLVLDYLACGLDPEVSILYRQSDLPETCELAWLLTTVTPMGLLQRAHSYKDKVAQGLQPDHGLFAYPVLMAADILQYNPELVPVGQDQKQHLEMTRDIAVKFNQTYGEEVFHLPEPHILESVAVVPGTDGRKMSKSYGNTLRMFWPKKRLRKAVMSIVTDSTPVEDPKDTDQTVFSLWALFATEPEREEMFARAEAGGLGYGDVKLELFERIMDVFGPMRERRDELAARPDDLEDILAAGAGRARELCAPILSSARKAAGLGR
ncbi:MAG: tryptophan--tRNA ligase [Deltaproteobacteria bacterium]|nr:tryptophan--tRNA ligase [Deltaproteobacteria bacterium]